MKAKTVESACIFCRAAQNPVDDRRTLVVHRGEHCFVILNRYPYTSGHLMIVPYNHVSKLTSVSAAGASEMMELARRAEQVLEAVYHPEGLNMGMNFGSAAGAGIAQHIHLHMLPRWSGDANFMTTVANTRIIPEALDDTYEKLSRAFAERTAGAGSK
ncbi:MAG: HIT domain-containing protein [Acidobacteriota bacterium]|nr:HIT domain-containing protein [Acidobacteriota bacterium]